MTSFSADWYVRTSAAGSNTGKDWSNAWSLSGIAWASVQPGDTIWLAGGSYSSLNIGKSGAAGKQIYIKRVTSANATPVAAAGWSSAFDSQVTFSSGVSVPARSYVTVDGNAPYGIKIPVGNGGIGVTIASTSSSPCNTVELKNLDIVGPGFRVTTAETNGIRASEGGDPPIYNLLVSRCRIQGMDTMVKADNWNNSVIEYTSFLNCSSGDMAAVHPDTIYFYPCTNVTVRYCRFENVDSESIFFDYGGSTQIYFYGNVMIQGSGSTSSAIELKQGYTWGTFFLYNNVFVGWTKGVVYRANAAAGSMTKNNIFWNCPNSTAGATSDYNGYSGVSAVGTHSITNTADPFVSGGTGDYHLKAGSWPINAGTSLGSPFDLDPDGKTRGSDGAWDLGAYEYGATTTTAPKPPTNLRIITP